MTNFKQMLIAGWAQNKFVCVGIDPTWKKLPTHLLQEARTYGDIQTLFDFGSGIVSKTHDIVLAYKPNFAFFEAFGAPGIEALRKIVKHIKSVSDVPVILDAKRGDIETTNDGSVAMAFDYIGADAITVQPYLGYLAMKPFLDQEDKGIIVLCKTSNKGSDEFQNLDISTSMDNAIAPLYKLVAENVYGKWNYNNNCLLVVGATYPEELKNVRENVGNMPILIPGIGAQGGDLERTLEAGFDENGDGVIINSSRQIIYASSGTDFAEAARAETLKLHESINHVRMDLFARS